MVKKYKLGQLITIDKKVYRITKQKSEDFCDYCDLFTMCNKLVIPTTNLSCFRTIGSSHFKLVKQPHHG